jgi:hypothetical protein
MSTKISSVLISFLGKCLLFASISAIYLMSGTEIDLSEMRKEASSIEQLGLPSKSNRLLSFICLNGFRS